MTASAKPDPLVVACPYCSAIRFRACFLWDRRSTSWWGSRKPHAARVKAAERAEKEKEKANG